MKTEQKILFCDYFSQWVQVYKKDHVAPVTMKKYKNALDSLMVISPNLYLDEITKRSYQELLNKYAETHEKQTTKDFHIKLKASLQDAVDERILDFNPAKKAVIKGSESKAKKQKYLNLAELEKLLKSLELNDEPSLDWLILILAKTGIRFSEALALTPGDFKFRENHIVINKSWDYKSKEQGFSTTKTKSSIRNVYIDKKLSTQIKTLLTNMGNIEKNEPIFVQTKAHNSDINKRLKKLCETVSVPVISAHSLRHTHASVLICQGVSLASVSQRLGHANVSTTQQVYIHVIKELEEKDTSKIIRCMGKL